MQTYKIIIKDLKINVAKQKRLCIFAPDLKKASVKN